MKIEKTKIVRVTPCSLEKTYNMTMRGPNHNYFANGILTANSHSVAYSYLAYQTAYLKAHYPTHFWAAVLSNEINNTAKVVKYIEEARGQGIEILPPDINESFDTFTPRGNTIRFGLAAIKGIGQSAVSYIVAAREEGGPFKSIFDFTERVDSRAVNKRVLESLIKAGAFDSLGFKRAQLFEAIDSAIESGARAQRARSSGQAMLFGAAGLAPVVAPEPPLPDKEEWSYEKMLSGEKETLGFYLTGHPLIQYSEALRDFATASVESLPSAGSGSIVSIGGMVTSLNLKTTKKGDRFALFDLEDQYGSVRVVVWPETYSRSKALLRADAAVLVKGKLEMEEEGAATIIAEEIQALDDIRERAARTIILRARTASLNAKIVDRLYGLLDRHRGECDVLFDLELEDGSVARVKPNQFVKVKITPDLTNAIKQLCDSFEVELLVPKK